jgi:Ni,Fe-hydrogenase maturation factor
VLVDASVEVERVTVRELDEVAAAGPVSHHLDVRALVRLARVLGDPPARVVTVAVPVRSLELGTRLDPATVVDVAEAAATVVGLCRTALGTAFVSS